MNPKKMLIAVLFTLGTMLCNAATSTQPVMRAGSAQFVIGAPSQQRPNVISNITPLSIPNEFPIKIEVADTSRTGCEIPKNTTTTVIYNKNTETASSLKQKIFDGIKDKISQCVKSDNTPITADDLELQYSFGGGGVYSATREKSPEQSWLPSNFYRLKPSIEKNCYQNTSTAPCFWVILP